MYQARRQICKDPRVITRYCDVLQQYFTRHNKYSRTIALYIDILQTVE